MPVFNVTKNVMVGPESLLADYDWQDKAKINLWNPELCNLLLIIGVCVCVHSAPQEQQLLYNKLIK